MKIELRNIKVKDLCEGYKDDAENGVVGYGGKLDIRPPFQREFVYKEEQRNAVIDTIFKGFPLNVMYWAVRADGTYEIIDGQQRTISICQYVSGDFSVNIRDSQLSIHNLQDDEKEKILNYELTVYVCEGTDSEKLEWFKTINIAGEELTTQELRNAVYAGSWVTDAKKFFSKTGCPASKQGNDYINGSAIRQEYLETVIKWISNGKIEEYMSEHQHDAEANDLRDYFKAIMSWIDATISPSKERKKIMKGVAWGELYNEFKDKKYDPKKIEKEVSKLILDDDVTNKKGIYPYVFTRKEKYLSIRAFTDAIKLKVYEKQKGKCAKCGKKFEIEQMDADHITPWSKGGHTTADNCQMLCKECNRKKSDK